MASQTTQLTANSNSTASGSGDSNQSTQIRFMSPANSTVWWLPTVSNAITNSVLPEDTGNDTVTFVKGLTVTFTALGGSAYQVTLTGQIRDKVSGTANISGLVIYSQT
ncbi:hypothetical protein [Paraburkholderia phenazinium]|jgi:hypothetical protein|uniref:Uncharacterized protein n=1 Tax=Paraburkholderia phenazinium TaxID=60549 RepID=A0A1G7W9C7_9BURK|nr:hypothetical protein [Paraburkholderia phenazinium]SDG68563.1 hypothetical protein SAMN05216466_104460 [Paraburkholderia phenazinium]